MSVRLLRRRRAERHIEKHGIPFQEVEIALEGPKYGRIAGNRLRIICRGRERYLFVVLRPVGGGRAVLVTARQATDSEKRLYLKRGKRS